MARSRAPKPANGTAAAKAANPAMGRTKSKAAKELPIDALFRRNPKPKEVGFYQSYYWGNNNALPFEWEDIVNSQPFAKLAMDTITRYVIGNGFVDPATAAYNTDVLAPVGNPDYRSLQDLVIACTKQALMFDGSFALVIRRATDGTICAVELCDHISELRKVPPRYVQDDLSFVWYPNMRIYGTGSTKYYYHPYQGSVISEEQQAEMRAIQEARNGGHYFGEVLWHYIPAYGVETYPIPKAFNGGEVLQANAATGRAIHAKAKVQFIPSIIITTPQIDDTKDENGNSPLTDFHGDVIRYNGSDVNCNVMHFMGATKESMPQATVLNTTDLVGPLTEAYDSTAKQILMMYGVDPALIGYSTAGQLGNNQQLSIAEQRLNELAKLTRNTVFNVLQGPVNAMAQDANVALDWTIEPLELYKSVPAEKWEVMTPEEKREYYGLPPITITQP